MTDLLATLTAARPTDVELDAMWSPADRDARLRDVVSRRPHRLRRPVLLAAAAAVAAALVVPVVVDSGDATAADLRALAASAVSYDGPVLREGMFLHERSTSLQRNSTVLSDGEVYDDERETWTAWDGTVWLVGHRPSAGWTSYDLIDERWKPSIGDPTPAFSATLPDDPDELRAYLDERVSGSSSQEEALFESLTLLATSHTLPPRTLAAVFEVMAGVDGVDTEDVVVGGRPAVEVSFSRLFADVLGTRTVVVDRATGQALSSTNDDPGGTYRSTTTLSEVVSEVPADVLAAFEQHGDGGIVCDADRPDCVLPR